MKKVLGLALIVVVLVGLMIQCSRPTNTKPPISSSNSEASYEDVSVSSEVPEISTAKCSDLVSAEKIVQDIIEKTYAEWEKVHDQYDDEYWENFDKDGYIEAFAEGYWSGFWRDHRYCRICQANGDVPAEFTKDSSK